ncbi:MAG: hypothetical protein AAF651_01780 [Cyanobacteria bacterium P01_C01_bin.73]
MSTTPAIYFAEISVKKPRDRISAIAGPYFKDFAGSVAAYL